MAPGLLLPLLLLLTEGVQGSELDPTGHHVCKASRWVRWGCDGSGVTKLMMRCWEEKGPRGSARDRLLAVEGPMVRKPEREDRGRLGNIGAVTWAKSA